MRSEYDMRAAICAANLDLVRSGLNQGTAGNVSARWGDGMLITPSGIAPEQTDPAMLAAMTRDGAWTRTKSALQRVAPAP